MLVNKLNPYMIYIKIIVVCAVIIGLFWLGWHEMGIRADLKAKTSEADMWKETTSMYAEQTRISNAFYKEVSGAIQKIKVQSNNYIQAVESSPPPPVIDGDVVVLMRPNQAFDLPIPYSNNSSNRKSSNPSGSRIN